MAKTSPWVCALLCSCLAPGLSLNAFADAGVTRTPIVDAPTGSTGLGFGFRAGTSPYRGIDNVASMANDNDIDLVPLYLYEGEYLYAHGTEAGIHLYRQSGVTIDLLARYRFDRLEADADDFFEGMDDREQTVDGGLRVSFQNNWGDISLSWVNDMLDRHEGAEGELTYRYPWQQGRWSFSPFISYVYQDSDLTGYYYGVEADEVNDERSFYDPGSTDFWRAGLYSAYRWSSNMLLFANIAVEGVPDEIYDSPLVDENQLSSALFGFTYLFGNIQEPSSRKYGSPFEGEWSWRVNAGYTAEETFHKVHRGYVKRSEDVHTYLAGLTLGKLLNEGRKIEYWGRFSLNRRLENDYQSNFWEYNAYVMAMGTGYSPWTDKELFRYGFGFGFSYAERVPMVEQVKQSRRDTGNSHFLNYLEAQVDFPMQNLFGDLASKDCYLGLTIVHRSGIFANSDILGNVSGGSDVLTGHVECKR